MASELRQRKVGGGEEEELVDSPVLVEKEDGDSEGEEEQQDEGEEDALTRRIKLGNKDPSAARTATERPGTLKMPKKRRRGMGEGPEDEAGKGGIRWMPIIFLVFMMMPAIFGAIDFLMSLPFFAKFRGPPNYRQCLLDYYRRVSPDRLQEVDVDSILRKYKGREHVMGRNLEARYQRKWSCP